MENASTKLNTRKRSVGVTIFGWWFIVINTFLLLSFALVFRRAWHILELDILINKIVYIITFFLSFAYIIAGILVLQLKENGRKLVLFVAVAHFLNEILQIFFSTNAKPVSLAYLAISFSLICGYCFFFTRPTVKAQFSKEA
ncbi:hypothetical protein ACFL38_00945 [Candidatus Omnitrophota bacterium]